MKKIFVIGAGLSSSDLIKYLLDNATALDWTVKVGDLSLELAKSKVNNHPKGIAVPFDINDNKQLKDAVAWADIIVSMLPAFMHPVVAKECVGQGKHMATASYVSDSMKALDAEAKQKGVTLLNELGVDPGIDHMSAMKVIDEIREKGGNLLGFISNTGGLVAPESDNNPWNYKFTWNPRNVVLAGQGVAQFIENGQLKFIPYHRLYSRARTYSVLNYGDFEMYPNRDSLQYCEIYNLKTIPTLIRGTLRKAGYCKAWNVFVQLGATDDTYKVPNSEDLTNRGFINSFLAYDPKLSVEEKIKCEIAEANDPVVFEKLRWLGVFEEKKVAISNASPAQILQKILEGKLLLEPNDKDMIVMQHIFDYEMDGMKFRRKSSMVIIGQDTVHTAMSITVGTPLAIAIKRVLTGDLKEKGVVIPTKPSVYLPILKELEEYGVKFIEEEEEIK
ncbi:MAG: saccharopine dehydrogenase [Bacteroidales bacterium]|nr:MAG: saccharopine dehydrogenase [Bacteroidales bacterium]